MEKGMRMARRALCLIALGMAACLFVVLAVCSLRFTSRLTTEAGMSEAVVIVRDALAPNLVLTLAALAGLWLVHAALERFAKVHVTLALAALWLIATLAFLFGAKTQQLYDFEYVMEGARLFARGNYKAMEVDYFNASSYQLGICLPMEIVLRALPGISLNMFMQALNALLSVASAGVLAALCELLAGRRARSAAVALYVTCLPAALYCAFVYATLPMVFLCSCAFLCFALYLRGRRLRFAAVCGVCLAVAVMLKPNSAIPLAALVILALVDAIVSRDWRLLLCMALTVALASLLARGVVWQYELRSGVTLAEDVSMLSRFTMGLQRGGAQAGWFNRYIEQFFPFEVTREQEIAVASADLAARLGEFAADPAMAAAFARDKMLSQWLEPTFGTMWYGNLCEQAGPCAQAASAVYAQGGAIRQTLEAYMNVWQQAMLLLAAIGTVVTIRRRGSVVQLILPVTVLGGFLYHMLFEAKSQYIYVYVLYMIPLAAQGLCALESAVKSGLARLKNRA